MRSHLSAIGALLVAVLLMTACSAAASELVVERNNHAEGSLVGRVNLQEAEPCQAEQRSQERSLESIVSEMPQSQRSAFVGALWERHRDSGNDTRFSGVLRRFLGYLVRDQLCGPAS